MSHINREKNNKFGTKIRHRNPGNFNIKEMMIQEFDKKLMYKKKLFFTNSNNPNLNTIDNILSTEPNKPFCDQAKGKYNKNQIIKKKFINNHIIVNNAIINDNKKSVKGQISQLIQNSYRINNYQNNKMPIGKKYHIKAYSTINQSSNNQMNSLDNRREKRKIKIDIDRNKKNNYISIKNTIINVRLDNNDLLFSRDI